MTSRRRHWLVGIVAVVVIGAGGLLLWWQLHPRGLGPGFAVANGRIEATEIDVATKLAGRIQPQTLRWLVVAIGIVVAVIYLVR